MTDEGRLDLDRLEEIVTARCRLIAVTHASNVTGAVTEVGRIVAAARAVGARVLLDGAQRAPHGPLDLPALGVDALRALRPQDVRPDRRRRALGARASCWPSCRRSWAAAR